MLLLGGTGRLGRLLGRELTARGHAVTALGRRTDPSADARDAGQVARAAAGHDVAVSLVTPASGPEELAALDPAVVAAYFTDVADGLLAGLPAAGVDRLLVVGLSTTLLGPDGRPGWADPAFPEQFRGFARAHRAGLDRLRADPAGAVDWLVLTPPDQLDPTGPRTGAYRLGGEDAHPGPLSYADLAVALADQVDAPTAHRTRISVRPASGDALPTI